jgi:PAS domain S-box-containing protein
MEPGATMSAAPPRDKGRADYLSAVLVVGSAAIVTIVAFTILLKQHTQTERLEFEREAALVASSGSVFVKPGPDDIKARAYWHPWAMLIGGLTFSALLGIYLVRRRREERRTLGLAEELERRGTEQTLDLDHANQQLQRPVRERERTGELLQAIGRAQSQFIGNVSLEPLFGRLLSDLLSLTDSEYGFIGEILHTDTGDPYLKTHAITNIAWNDETRDLYRRQAPNLEFYNLKTLFGAVMTTGQPVIANDPATDSRRGGLPPGHAPLRAFLGLPFHGGGELVGMVGVANRPGGYNEELIEYLQPLLATCGQLIGAHRSDQLRLRMEELLRTRERELSDFVQNAIVPMHWVGPDGRILWANQAELDLLGFSKEEYFGRHISEFHVDQAVVEGILERLAAHETIREHEARLRCKDGSIKDVLISSNVCFEGERFVHTRCFTRDITGRKQAEQALRESEERFQLIARATNDAVWDWDVLTNEVRWNDGLQTLFGYKADEISPTYDFWIERVHPDDQKRILSSLHAVMDSGQTLWSGDYRFRRADGSWAYVFDRGYVMRNANGHPVRMIGSMMDITERTQAEQSLEHSRALLQSFVEHTPAAVAMFDKELRYVAVSRRWLHDYRLGDQNLIGRHHYEVFPEIRTRKEWQEVHQRCLAGAVERRDEERFMRQDGREDWLRWEVRPWYDVSGEVGGIIMFTEVITDRKREEATRQALYQASLQIQEHPELKARLDDLVQTARMVLELDRINILLADPEGQWLQAAASLGTEDPLEAIRVPIGPGGGGIAQAFRTKQMVIWDGQGPVPGPLRLQPPYDQIEALRSQVFANVPLVVQGRAIGVLGTDRRHSGRLLDRSTLEMLQLFAAQAAMSIEHARTFERLQFHSAALKRFYEATAQINLSLDLDEMLRMIAKAGVEACGSATGNVILFDDEGKISHFALWDPSGVLTPDKLKIRPDGLTRKALESGKMEIISDFSQEPPGRINPAPLQAGRLTAACMPLPLQEGKGVLWVHFNVPHRFTHEETALLQAFAQEAAVALHEARLFEPVRGARGASDCSRFPAAWWSCKRPSAVISRANSMTRSVRS